MWRCHCDCGTIVSVRDDMLKSGHTRSCGCLQRDYARNGDARRTHGLTPKGNHAPEHGVWTKMKARCFNKQDHAYMNYGGRGITVCPRWKNSFQNFIEDMGRRPSSKHTIDRTDNDGPYSPDNCEWKTRRHQNRNKRNNIRITANGKTQIIADWARELGINATTIEARYHKGWSHHDIINKPIRPAAPRSS